MPKALLAENRHPSARTTSYPPARSALASVPAGIGKAEESSEKLANDSAPRKRHPDAGVQDQGRVPGVLGLHHADGVPGIVLDGIKSESLIS